ncbi:MAG: formylglycine-generating enzyme family protein [Opitutales bacterium]
MIFCPPGTFTMGSPSSESGRGGDETQHQVTLTNGFYLGKYEVTQAQYQTVMNGNSAGFERSDPSLFKGSKPPGGKKPRGRMPKSF